MYLQAVVRVPPEVRVRAKRRNRPWQQADGKTLAEGEALTAGKAFADGQAFGILMSLV